MSDIVTNAIFLDGLRDRESVAGSIAGALRDLEAYAGRTGERIIWDTISFETDTNYIDERSLLGSISTHEVRTLKISARTIDPAEVSGA